MKSLIFETLPTAILVGAEAFFLAAGAVWVLLWQAVPRDVWIWPAFGAGAVAAIATALALYRSAFLAARAEAAFAQNVLLAPDSAGEPE